MCTCAAFEWKEFYFGRNMDLEGHFGEGIVFTPRNFPLCYRMIQDSISHYAILGVATVIDGYPLYADGFNEKGLCMAGLNFPDNAYYYEEAKEGNLNLTPFEFIPYILGECANLEQVREKLKILRLVGLPFSAQVGLGTLHWQISDVSGSLVVEQTKDGLSVYENPCGVMANNPTFDRQLARLGAYSTLDNLPHGADVPKGEFSLGLGGVGLPGDLSSPSRLVRLDFLKRNTIPEKNEEGRVKQVFSLMGAVAMPKGSVLDDGGREHYTTYTCCMDAASGRYYLSTAESLSIRCADMQEQRKDAKALLKFEF